MQVLLVTSHVDWLTSWTIQLNYHIRQVSTRSREGQEDWYLQRIPGRQLSSRLSIEGHQWHFVLQLDMESKRKLEQRQEEVVA
jgi:hypothetical protein